MKAAKIGDVMKIGGVRVVCVPDYFITNARMPPGSVGILLTPEAADSLIAAMREAGIMPTDKASAPTSPASPPLPPLAGGATDP